MPFGRIEYMHWAKATMDVAPAPYSLASSGIEPASAAEAGLDPMPRLAISGDVPPTGHPALRERIAERAGVALERVLPATGTSLANFLAAAALLGPGDLALCETPVYEPIPRVLEAVGARVEYVPRHAERGFAIDMAAVERGFRAGARLLAVTDLHNPTGALLERQAVRDLGALAARHDAWVIVDEVYLHGIFDRDVETAARLGERLIVTSSLTKIYGLPGLRAGWLIAPPAVIERAIDVNDHLGVHAPHIADEAAAEAFLHLDALRTRARQRREANWPVVREALVAAGARFHEPAGGFTVFVRLPGGEDAHAFARRLRAERETQVTPGAFFGVPDHVRLGYGGRPEKVREAIRRFAAALAATP